MRRFLTLAVGATLGLAPVLAMAAPDQAPSTMSPSGQTAAPAPDAATIGKAGAALHDVALVQEKYQGKIDSATPAQKQTLSAQANAEAVQAIQSRGLSVQQYTNVVRVAQNDPKVKQQLLDVAKSQR
jgi:Domain of unknown function (DUF4168)